MNASSLIVDNLYFGEDCPNEIKKNVIITLESGSMMCGKMMSLSQSAADTLGPKIMKELCIRLDSRRVGEPVNYSAPYLGSLIGFLTYQNQSNFLIEEYEKLSHAFILLNSSEFGNVQRLDSEIIRRLDQILRQNHESFDTVKVGKQIAASKKEKRDYVLRLLPFATFVNEYFFENERFGNETSEYNPRLDYSLQNDLREGDLLDGKFGPVMDQKDTGDLPAKTKPKTGHGRKERPARPAGQPQPQPQQDQNNEQRGSMFDTNADWNMGS